MDRRVDAMGAAELVKFLGNIDVKSAILREPGKTKSIEVMTPERTYAFKFSVRNIGAKSETSESTLDDDARRVRILAQCGTNGDRQVLHESGVDVVVSVNNQEQVDNSVLQDLLYSLLRIAQDKEDQFEGFVLTGKYLDYLDIESCYVGVLPDLIHDLTAMDHQDERVDTLTKVCKVIHYFGVISDHIIDSADDANSKINELLILIEESPFDARNANNSLRRILDCYDQLKEIVRQRINPLPDDVKKMFRSIEQSLNKLREAVLKSMYAGIDEQGSRVDLDHKKLLDYLIDEKEEKYIELVEGTRSHIAQMDNYLKRLAIALEDDFKVQFYDPAFEGVRAEGRNESVNLGQIERTTILTNNRTFAKVSPQASMEFDLPKRAPVVVEAMSGAKALMQDYGALVDDPTFVGLTGALSGSPAVGGAGNGSPPQVKPLFPTQGTDSQNSFLAGGPPGTPGGRQKTSIEQLIPDPAVYKIQTGTGFEIRPVIQPDGHSIMYDLNYLYTTNVREPVDPDEKHLGRVKQHYIHTQVQTSSFELREISRYQVALKVSRTNRGVPLLEDIPVAGALFRPAASAESSLQQNIILGQTTVYPTLFDLMGLRWSRHVADLDHTNLRDLEHVVRGRKRSINDYVFERASKQVDNFLDIERHSQQHHRPDLYHRQSRPSPYHPGGYVYPDAIDDPTGRNDFQRDRRPIEFRQPEHDTLRRGPKDYYQDGAEQINDSSPIYMHEPTDDAQSTFSRSEAEPVRQANAASPLFPPSVSAKSSIQRMSYERTAPVRR